MKKSVLFILTICIMAFYACTEKEETNPFLTTWETPQGVPPFNLIKNEHYMPAFEEGMKQQNEKIEAIISNTEAPSFENTIVAMDFSGELLKKVASVFFNLNECNTSDELQAIAMEVAPKLSAHSDNIVLNAQLFERVKAVYEQKDSLDLTEAEAKLLEDTYKSFVRNGAALPADKQERFREINSELSVLTLQFGQNVLADVNQFKLVIENEADLAGLPQAVIDEAAALATKEGQEGKWIFTLQNYSVMPFLTYAENRDLRELMGRAYINRGNNDNEYNNGKIINRIIELRIERTKLLGYSSYAEYAIEDRMAGSVERVESFTKQLWDAALPVAKNEAAQLQAMINAEGKDFKLAFWDWRYYAEKVRKEKFALDENELRQYFEINHVRDGIFMVANKLYGLKFEQRFDVPVYHPDATVWEVQEADGTFIGLLYMDMYPRESKRSGAWMTSFRDQHVDLEGNFVTPVISLVCNFTKPVGDTPSLLTFDEVTTFFHEFGHSLHGLLSKVKLPSQSGTSVDHDFVELPSQVMENWARHPEVLKMYAKHYQTGEVIPDELIEKLKAAGSFNQGFETVEFMASALLDMEYHILTEYTPFEVKDFEQKVKDKFNMMDEIYFRHGSTHFQHIFSGGYSAGYYSYIWAGVLDADAFEAFVETGDLFDQETARKFRTEVLERGGTRDAMEMYKAFRGKEPGIEPLLRQRGLIK